MMIDTQAGKTPAQIAEAAAYRSLIAARSRLIRLASAVPSEYLSLADYRQDLLISAAEVADATEGWDHAHAAL